MNQMTLGSLTAAPMRRPTQRALAKLRTREKILAAAKALFTERGYEGATIRDIASGAGMSTGAVFASFTDKSDLFAEIVRTEQTALFDALRHAAEGLTPKAAILAMVDAAAERHMADLALLQATMSALWAPGLGAQLRSRVGLKSVSELIVRTLTAGIESGEITVAADPVLIAAMLRDSYVSVLSRAAREGVTLEGVKRRAKAEVEIILAGAQKR
jgi:AcrR family transcriptional regulator